MTDLSATIDAHLAAYCDPDAQRRANTVGQAWADNGRLIDPPFAGTGPDEIGAMADAVLAHYLGHSFRRITTVDEHHGFARYGWELISPDGAKAVAGTDFAEVDGDGRLVRIVGFFGDPAAAEH